MRSSSLSVISSNRRYDEVSLLSEVSAYRHIAPGVKRRFEIKILFYHNIL